MVWYRTTIPYMTSPTILTYAKGDKSFVEGDKSFLEGDKSFLEGDKSFGRGQKFFRVPYHTTLSGSLPSLTV